MKNVLIVTNFNAGRKQAIKYKKKVLNFVLEYAAYFKFVDIDEFKNTDLYDFDTIIAMGGDGTVNKVLPYVCRTQKSLGIIPCGTANLLAAKLGIPSNIDKALNIIKINNIKPIDVLNINDKLCILRCGLGYDADIICKTPQSLKNKFGYLAYFIAGIIFALRLKKKKYELTIDNNPRTVEASCIIFSNASNMYKNFVSVGKDTKLDDNLADIFILKTTNPIIFFIEFLKILLNIKNNGKYSEFLKAKDISVLNNWQVCHIDGEKTTLKDNISLKVINSGIRVFSAKPQ